MGGDGKALPSSEHRRGMGRIYYQVKQRTARGEALPSSEPVGGEGKGFTVK